MDLGSDLWVLTGDLNETISKEDRKTGSHKGYKFLKNKFVSSFLDTSQGIDLWRHLHPITGRADYGHTRFSRDRRSSARIDYFLLSRQLVSNASAIEMEVGARDRSLSDHCRIACHITSPGLLPTLSLNEDIQIRHPNLERLSDEKRFACRDVINQELTKILIDTRKVDLIDLETADQLSKDVARCIIDNALKIAQQTGKKKSQERKSRFTRELEREIGLIREVRDLLRKLGGNLSSPEKETSLMESLHLYLDILSLMDLPSLPLEISVKSLTKWSDESAEQEIERLQRYIKFDQTKQESDEKQWKRDLFLDPKKRGKWIDLHFKPHRTGPPDFAIDGQTNEKTRDPKKVKEIYLKEGTIFLRKKLQPPGPEEEIEAKYEPAPSLSPREDYVHTLSSGKDKIPQWWKKMYNRNAKRIRLQYLGGIDERDYKRGTRSYH